ncbi:MAG: aminotransferase class III-fold pyridoxal phosphate-dependent enzyme [Pleurocapsa minor GSE-CHR-MK-17-07R]|jgi:4-aminobutyrate aminotransferase|nr:aminotransferase class III-fold pyridoxal phosphate-dependent enzyme [Pleurocapsa minor GSE-CHR-MK 17-07R]
MQAHSLDHLSPVWSHLTTMQPVRGEGAYLYDGDGTRYLDFTSGIGVTNTGHSHPHVVKAIQEQAANLLHGQINIVIPPSVARLSHMLDAITPSAIDCFFFSNSGAEATEGAVKLARQATKRQNIIVFQGSFHGRTAQTMAMTTSKTVYRAGYQPLPGGIFVAPFPYSFYYGWDEEKTVDWCIEQLHLLLKSQTAPEETAAIFIEPVLGEGGYVAAPVRFLQALREICTQHGIMLVIDEVQTGFGRTGKMFAIEYADVQPDILVMAKGLGSGVPISAVGSSKEFMSRWTTGSHGGTYGGNALAAAAACATIEVMQGEDLPGNAARMGAQLMDGLKQIQAEFPVIGEVRGKGLMIGIEFGRTGAPNKDAAKVLQKKAMAHNLLLLTCGSYENTIRLIPPLVISEAQVNDALGILAESAAYAQGYA